MVNHLLTMAAQRTKAAKGAPPPVTDEQLVLGIKHVVVPMLTRAFEKAEGPAILDAACMQVTTDPHLPSHVNRSRIARRQVCGASNECGC